MVQSFTACMPLLTATSTFVLGRRCRCSQQCCLHCLCTMLIFKMHTWSARGLNLRRRQSQGEVGIRAGTGKIIMSSGSYLISIIMLISTFVALANLRYINALNNNNNNNNVSWYVDNAEAKSSRSAAEDCRDYFKSGSRQHTTCQFSSYSRIARAQNVLWYVHDSRWRGWQQKSCWNSLILSLERVKLSTSVWCADRPE